MSYCSFISNWCLLGKNPTQASACRLFWGTICCDVWTPHLSSSPASKYRLHRTRRVMTCEARGEGLSVVSGRTRAPLSPTGSQLPPTPPWPPVLPAPQVGAPASEPFRGNLVSSKQPGGMKVSKCQAQSALSSHAEAGKLTGALTFPGDVTHVSRCCQGSPPPVRPGFVLGFQAESYGLGLFFCASWAHCDHKAGLVSPWETAEVTNERHLPVSDSLIASKGLGPIVCLCPAGWRG